MTKKQRTLNAIQVLKELYPEAKCSLDASNAFELLVAVRLSAQCTDARVNLVTPQLFGKYKTLDDYANADVKDIENIVKPCGFYKNKAKNIIASSKDIVSRFGGEIPSTMEELTSLAGVGRKTANLILGDVFSQPAIVVDTHCIRLTNRFGLVKESDPVKIEFAIRKILNPKTSNRFCHQLVLHGRAVCRARNPHCAECPVNELCKYYKDSKKDE